MPNLIVDVCKSPAKTALEPRQKAVDEIKRPRITAAAFLQLAQVFQIACQCEREALQTIHAIHND